MITGGKNVVGARVGIAEPTQRETEVSQALLNLENLIENLSGLLPIVEERLRPILRSEELAGKDAPKAIQYQAPLANRIDTIADRVTGIKAWLSYILERVEL